MLTSKQLKDFALKSIEDVGVGVTITAENGDHVFLTDEALDAIIAARTTARRANQASFSVYDMRNTLLATVRAADGEEALAIVRGSGYDAYSARVVGIFG